MGEAGKDVLRIGFDRAIRVQSPDTHDYRRVKLRKSEPLFVRIPPWLNRDEVNVEFDETQPT